MIDYWLRVKAKNKLEVSAADCDQTLKCTCLLSASLFRSFAVSDAKRGTSRFHSYSLRDVLLTEVPFENVPSCCTCCLLAEASKKTSRTEQETEKGRGCEGNMVLTCGL